MEMSSLILFEVESYGRLYFERTLQKGYFKVLRTKIRALDVSIAVSTVGPLVLSNDPCNNKTKQVDTV